MSLSIIGAGLAGLLAGNMLAHRHPIIFEQQATLPNNHSAVLRFRSSQIGDITHIPFRRVTRVKTTVSWRNPVADSLAYSFKNMSTYRSDRSINDGTKVEDRYVAPCDFIARLAERCSFQFNTKHDFTKSTSPSSDIIISTIPMPILMDQLYYPQEKPTFSWTNGTNISARIRDCDAYVSILVPDPQYPFSRISITQDELMLECYQQDFDIEMAVNKAAYLLGIPLDAFSYITHRAQRYAKINPVDDNLRKHFMHWATDKFGIFSLRRFATWRPGLLLDDLVNDIRLIDGWINNCYTLVKYRR